MKNCSSIRASLLIGTIILIISLIVTSISIGYNVLKPDKATTIENYDYYHISEIPDFIQHLISKESKTYDDIESEKINKKEETIQQKDDFPMDSPWPMYCHDIRHTGRSPYNTLDTWDEIWRFKQHVNDYVRGSPIIGDDGTIYFGGADFYALYPNGTLKWKYDDLDFYVWSAPAIDEDGTIYFGDKHGYFYAINSNGTLKWQHFFGDDILSSPVIGNDGTIYFGDANHYINALFPNGTVRWRYKTDLVVYSSPAISDNGIVYCGSHDTYLYALYPNNGTLKWKYKTGDWIRTSPCIADDGTIYVVSLDDYLHAVNPDGSFKWKTNVGAGTSPTIGQDGTIYAGYETLYALDPDNGSVKWTFDINGNIKGSTPAHSLEDTIYFGTSNGWLYAVNANGTLKWRDKIANEFIDSAPAISKDGYIYVGSASKEEIGGSIYNVGYLHAFGVGNLKADANGPYYGLINESVQFEGYSKGGFSPHSYLWDFGDNNTSDEKDPTHIYMESGNYTVVFTVIDNNSNISIDTTFAWIQDGNNPPNTPVIDGPSHGNPGIAYNYKFTGTDLDGSIIYLFVDWDDGSNTGWLGPYNSDKEITFSHKWSQRGTYTIRCKAKDPYGAESDWSEFKIIIPRVRVSAYQWFLERFQILEKIRYCEVNCR